MCALVGLSIFVAGLILLAASHGERARRQPPAAGPAQRIAAVRSVLLPAAPAAAMPRGAIHGAMGALPGVAAVSFPARIGPPAVQQRLARLGLHADGTLAGLPDRTVYRVRLPAGPPVDRALDALAALPDAIASEPVFDVPLQWRPNDPAYATQQQYLPAIGAEEAWSIQRGDRSIVVAVIDSGIDIHHPDLQGQIWTNPNAGNDGCGDDLHGCNFVDPSTADPSCPSGSAEPAPNGDISPSYFHGTFVAGVLGARTNNGIGIAGVVPYATIMPVKAGDCVGVATFAEAQGILYAVQQGARIINLSIGEENCAQSVSYVRDAIAQAQAAGVLVVAAAGNTGRNCISPPANVPGVLTVASTDATLGAHAAFSDWGPEVAVAAPGAGIAGLMPGPDALYGVEDGTSFSAPIVTGLADLLLSQNPLLTPDMLRDLIQRGAAPLPDGGTPGWAGAGRIDLAASLRLVPAAVYGHVTVNGAPAPDGTPVDAVVAGQACGSAQTGTVGGESVFAVFVPPAATTAGCGRTGAAITLEVNGVPAGRATWTAEAIPLDLDASSATTISPPAGSTGSVADRVRPIMVSRTRSWGI